MPPDQAGVQVSGTIGEGYRNIAKYTGAPIMVIGDLLQAGQDYAEKFLLTMKKYRIENEVAIEFFHPPPADFVRKVADSLINFNVEISPNPMTRGQKGFREIIRKRGVGGFH